MFVAAKDAFVHQGFLEIADFFGPDMRWDWCNSHDQKGHQEASRYATNDDFVRGTGVFIYQNLGLMVQGIHRPYIAHLLNMCRDRNGGTGIDVGAGGGQLGIALHELGFSVSFADIQSLSLKYLSWRLHRRGLMLPIYNLDSGVPIPRHNLAVCFDVLEHLVEEEQIRLLAKLDEMAEIVMVNMIHAEIDALHFGVDADRLTSHIKGSFHRESFYPDENGNPRQTLVIYGEGLKE